MRCCGRARSSPPRCGAPLRASRSPPPVRWATPSCDPCSMPGTRSRRNPIWARCACSVPVARRSRPRYASGSSPRSRPSPSPTATARRRPGSRPGGCSSGPPATGPSRSSWRARRSSWTRRPANRCRRARPRWAAWLAPAASHSATTTIRRSPPPPSWSGTAGAGRSPAIWAPWPPTAPYLYSGAVPSASTRGARRSTPRRSRRCCAAVMPSTTSSWWAHPTSGGGRGWWPWSNRRRESRQPRRTCGTCAGKYLAGFKVPKAVVFVEHIMRSPSGKADYRWAAEVAAGD